MNEGSAGKLNRAGTGQVGDRQLSGKSTRKKWKIGTKIFAVVHLLLIDGVSIRAEFRPVVQGGQTRQLTDLTEATGHRVRCILAGIWAGGTLKSTMIFNFKLRHLITFKSNSIKFLKNFWNRWITSRPLFQPRVGNCSVSSCKVSLATWCPIHLRRTFR